MIELRIKDICTKGYSSLKQKDVEKLSGDYPVYGASGQIAAMQSYHQEDDYIAIVKDGSGIGRVMFLPAKSSVIGTMQYILPKSGYDINYIGYCLQSLDLSSYKQGAAIPHIYFRDYGERLVKVEESLTAQKEIVAKINAEFAKIDQIEKTTVDSLNETLSLYHATLQKEMTPQNWESATLKNICSKIGSGATPKGGRRVYTSDGCSIIRSMNVHHNYFKYDELAHITDTAANALKGVSVKQNDILFNITGASIARCCIVPSDILPARVNQHVCILRVEHFVTPEFLCYQLNSGQHQKALLAIGETGSTRQALTKQDLERHLIYYPSPVEQLKITARLKEMTETIVALQNNCEKTYSECESLKDSILRQIFKA